MPGETRLESCGDAVDADVAREQVLEALHYFSSTSLSEILATRQSGEPEPEHLQEDLLRLFRATAQLVPAFAAFLADSGVSVDAIASVQDLCANVPLVDKVNYLQRYQLPQRCIGGALAVGDVDFCHVSSGSSGEPTFWARSTLSELTVATRFEQILCDNFRATETPLLCVNAFPLGSWVGGIFTTFCLRYCAIKGLKITIVTPGNVPSEILRCISHLGPLFPRTCILGYPPFVKGLIDAGRVAGVDWAARDICLVLAGEVFSEEWRQLVATRAGIAVPLRDIVSIYGTADAGVLGNETWLSACIREWLSQRPAVAKELFEHERLPTLVQYDPALRFIQVTPQRTLAITNMDSLSHRPASPLHASSMGVATPRDGHIASDGTVLRGPPPLVRYHIHDRGGTLSYDALLEFVGSRGFSIPPEVQGRHIARRLPFCWVFGREHWSVSLYGANVFVDQCMVALEQPGVSESVTGKFILDITSDEDANPSLWLLVECAPSQSPSDLGLVSTLQERVRQQLLKVNSEFANYVPADSQVPTVTLYQFGDSACFPVGVKHKWTR